MSIRYSKYLSSLVFLNDLLLLNLAMFIANVINHGSYINESYTPFLSLLINGFWIAISSITRSYIIRRPLVLRDNVNRFIGTLIYHLLAIFGFFYFFKLFDYSRASLISGYSLFFILVVLSRSVAFFTLDYVRKKGLNHRQILIIGDSEIAGRLQQSFKDHPEYGYDLAAFIPQEQLNALNENELKILILNKKPDEVFICYKDINSSFLNCVIKLGDENFIKVKVVSDLTLENTKAKLLSYNNLPVLQVSSHPDIPAKILVLKRTFDVAFSSCVMITGVPVFIILYVITKITSPGPAFYKQQRVGRSGKPFYIYKFRSMFIDAEKFGPQLSSDHDPRVTKWGRIIRRTRLDELPQFWNVLKGEMSVVGPRPERQHYIEQIIERSPKHRKLLHIKPGLTSIGQVYYGYAENVNQMCDRSRYDLLYLQNVSLNSDLSVILKTVKVMVQRKGK